MSNAPDTAPTTPTIHEDTQVDVHEPVRGRPLEVRVDDRGVERAIRKLRRIMAGEGILREIKRRRHYEKPSVKDKRKVREAERRRKRRERKRIYGP
jgi:small subunit ribosomal protein S21